MTRVRPSTRKNYKLEKNADLSLLRVYEVNLIDPFIIYKVFKL